MQHRGLRWGIAMAFVLAVGTFVGSTYARSPDSIECGGHLVDFGETLETVLKECGPPSVVKHRRTYYRGRHGVEDVWIYQRAGSFARVLTFADGALVWIEAQSQFH